MPAEANALHNVFRVNLNGNQKVPAKISKRNRDPVSCNSCRSKKLRCDRLTPCSSCSERGIGRYCTYVSPRNAKDASRESSRTLEAQNRLERLEGLVTNLMSLNRQQDTPAQSISSSDQLNNLSIDDGSPSSKTGSTGGGRLEVQSDGISYHGSMHWQAILENIQGIKTYLESESSLTENEPSSEFDADPVVEGHTMITTTEAINALPPRSVVDASLSIYFNAKYLAIPVLHTVKFRREYEAFWSDPSSVSLLWLSIIFSILCTASKIAEATGQSILDMAGYAGDRFYYIKASQCLITGGYKHAKPYSLEALLQYSLCRHMMSRDPDTDGWTIMGYATRLAMKMGYHRDPKQFANISSFEGEMRRRVWMIVEAFDLLFSFQMGLPPIIHEDEYDTEPPSNLADEDFDEDCSVLPLSRPPTDPTPMLYYSFKTSCVRMFRKIVRHCMCLKEKPYEETMRLDAALRSVHADTPPSLQMRPLSLSFTDQPSLILNRINLELFYLKGLCVLHRQYLTFDRSNSKYAYSRHICAEAAFKLLKLQEEINLATQPGGQLFREKWMHINPTLQDFLLAAMILCLALHESRSMEDPNPEEWRKKYEAIKTSHQYWDEKKAFLKDAARASAILARMLYTLKSSANTSEFPSQSTNTSSAPAQNTPDLTFSSDGGLIPPDHAPILYQWPSISLPGLDPNGSIPQSLDAMVTHPEAFDWTLIDQYLGDRTLGQEIESGEVSQYDTQNLEMRSGENQFFD